MDENRNQTSLRCFWGGKLDCFPHQDKQSDRKQTWDVMFCLTLVFPILCFAEEAAPYCYLQGRGRTRRRPQFLCEHGVGETQPRAWKSWRRGSLCVWHQL